MRTTFTSSKSVPAGTAVVAIPVASDGPVPAEIGLTRAQLAAMGFEGRCCSTLALPPAARSKTARVLVGIGAVKDLDENTMRNIGAAAARACSRHASMATSIAGAGRLDRRAAAKVFVEGAALALHRWADLKHDKSSVPALRKVVLLSADAQVRTGIAEGTAVATAVCTARDHANTPPSHLTATRFAREAVAIAKKSGLRATVYDKKQLQAMGCGGIVGVNAGSVEPPRVVKLVWAPAGAKKKVVLVGKGVMYDSGGISLKPSDASHASMKMDMSGAAAVLGAMSALRALKVKTHVTAYLMCTDNLPSGSAMKLGDVLTFRNGKTAEIHNTDAEGRLILADGLSLGAETKPDAMVDIATLTGACMAALGKKMAGVLGNNQGVVDQLLASSRRTDELIWQLPLFQDYRALLDSNVADMKNVGGPYGGAITASLFLNEFTGGIPWAHLDIAGPMEADGDNGWLNRGATAFGTRLLIDFVANFDPAGLKTASGTKKSAGAKKSTTAAKKPAGTKKTKKK
ncbi:MAG: leucyl aminopeptidase [Actinobacteria bacterium]|jgi:leucyl aminopeptidase|nr:leucyl aminopeptidase [Actinomycetota bacterium]